jgi:DNA (cytosine-5)-methyltransferase 1
VKPRLLDLYCAAGGMTKGYQQAGFYVVGVDIDPQPNYCGDEFIQTDAVEFAANLARMDAVGMLPSRYTFDVIHASPPCQRYMRSGNVDHAKHPDLLGPTREALEATGLPYVIENVPGAPMRADLLLCGSMFGLEVRRHRWFEMNWPVPPWTPACDHSRPITGVYGHPHGEGGAAAGMLPGDLETWSRAMGIDWMTAKEIALAIPPSYAEFIGARLLEHLAVAA